MRENKDGSTKPAALGGGAIADVCRGLASLVDVGSDEMPCWLPRAMGADGRPNWSGPITWTDRLEQAGDVQDLQVVEGHISTDAGGWSRPSGRCRR